MTLIFFSCTNKQEKATIVADWEFDKFINLNEVEEKNLPPYNSTIHEEFEFFQNVLCDYKNGFKEVIENKEKEKRYIKFSKLILKYKLENNHLILSHLNNKIFNKYFIKKITSDSLIFIDTKNKTLLFYKKIIDNPNKIEFDKIIVTSSGCFGPCRVNSIIVDKNGFVILNNFFNTEKNGTFTSKISKNQYNEILRKFNKVNIDTLKTDYSFSATDGNSISVSFIKDGKIYKTINDYMSQSPTSFRQAYTELIYLSQFIDLKENILPKELDFFTVFSFSKNNQKIELKEAEGAYLISELMKSSISTNKSFNPKYKLHFLNFPPNNNKIIHIYSDGRYYKFVFDNKKEIIRDLGYNFIDLNQLKFKK